MTSPDSYLVSPVEALPGQWPRTECEKDCEPSRGWQIRRHPRSKMESQIQHGAVVFEYREFIQVFVRSGILDKAEWPDLQKGANWLHSFIASKLAKVGVCGKPNSSIEKHRASFDFPAQGAGSEEQRMPAFRGTPLRCIALPAPGSLKNRPWNRNYHSPIPTTITG